MTLLASTTQPASGRYLVDPSRTTVRFAARMFGLFKVTGRFAQVSGAIDIDVDLTRSRIVAQVAAYSLTTGNIRRDDHLRSPGFLNAPVYSALAFHSSAISAVPSGGWQVDGELTVRGLTRKITFDVQPLGREVESGRIRLVARTTLSRSEFGVSAYRFLIGNSVQVTIEMEARR